MAPKVSALGNNKHMVPTTVRGVYPQLQCFFKETYPDLLKKHGRPISEANLDRLCGKVLHTLESVWDKFHRGHVATHEDNLAVCCLSKCEVLKVVKGALALQCQIIKTSPKNVAMPRRIYKDHFVFCFEVDDPDEPVNPSLYFILPMVMEDFFGVPDVAERLECQRWILELSGDSSNTHVKPNLVINRDCLVAGCQVDSVNPQSRYGRAVWEDTAARSGTCFACKKDIGRESAKKCSGCKRVTYCSKECQKEDWKGHKPGCKMTLQQIQQAEVV